MADLIHTGGRAAGPPVEAAILLGEWDELGSVETGKRADLIAVGGRPLQDVSVLEDVGFVMKGGIVYKRNGRPVPTPGR